MTFRWSDVRDLLAQLDAEAREQPVDHGQARAEALRLAALYPAMAPILAGIAERLANGPA